MYPAAVLFSLLPPSACSSTETFSQTLRSRLSCCWACRDEPSAPLYLIKPFFYCCHSDTHLSAEAALQHPDNLIGWQHPDRLGRVVSMHWDAQQRLVVGWQMADSELSCHKLMKQLQVLSDGSNYAFCHSGWLTRCHFRFKVELFHVL